MKRIKTDVTIIGAGVAGLYLSRLLDEKGIDYLTLDSKTKINNYGSRIINKETFKKLRIDEDSVLYRIKDINFYSPSEIKIGTSFNFERGYSVNLHDIEKRTFESISDNKRVHFGEPVIYVDISSGTVITKKCVVNSKIIVIATGALQNLFRSILGVSEPKNVFCFANEIRASDFTTTVLDNELSKGFYGWVIPSDDKRIEIGFGTENLEFLRLRGASKILQSMPYIKKYSKFQVLKTLSGFIPVTTIDQKSGSNWAIIGDAAGGEPLLGSSIHKSIDEAVLLSDLIERTLSGGDTSLSQYNLVWEKTIGQDIQKQAKLREVLYSSSNQEIDRAFTRINPNKLDSDGLINGVFANLLQELMSSKKSTQIRS